MLTIKHGTDTLASGSLADAMVQRLVVNGVVLIEEAEFVRAEAITIFDRGNRRNTVEIEIWKLHDSKITALHHRVTHADEITGRFDLVIQLSEDGDSYTATLASAGWRSVSVEATGVSTRTTYEIVGGRFTTDIEVDLSNIYDGGSESAPPAEYDVWVDCGNEADAPLHYREILDFNA